jgi:mono/diheme cytochrome c family protein
LVHVAGVLAIAGSTSLLHAQAPAPNAAAQDPKRQNPVVAPSPARAPAATTRQPTFDPQTVERGQKLFSTNCAFCHGGNAKGGETGPDLLRSVVVLHDENGDKIGPVVLNGRLDKGMPKFPFTQAQVADIATFLHERVQAAAERGSYKILDIVVGDPHAGQAYFNGAGGCTGCHSVTGDLAHIGTKYDAVGVQQHIVQPGERNNRAPSPASRTVTITLPSGEQVSGYLAHIDDFSVVLIDKENNYRSFTREGETPKIEIHDPLKAHTDMLPKYTDSDIHNLTAYLVTLK